MTFLLRFPGMSPRQPTLASIISEIFVDTVVGFKESVVVMSEAKTRLKLPPRKRTELAAFNVRMKPTVMQWWVNHVSACGFKDRNEWMENYMKKMEGGKNGN